MRRGIGRLRAGGSGVDSDAAAWAAAVTGAGGTYSASTLAALSTKIKDMKAAGLWAKMALHGPICGDQLAAALIQYRNGSWVAATNVNFVGGDYTEATGLTGNGSTKYLQTGFNPSVSLTLNNTHVAVYNRASSSVGGGSNLDCRTGGATQVFGIAAPFSDGNCYDFQYLSVNNAGAVIVAVGTSPYGHFVGSRTGAAAHTLYKRGSSIGTDVGSGGVALPNFEMYVQAANGAGTPTQFSAHPLSMYSAGSSLSAGEAATYNTIEQAFQTALGRSV